VSKKRTCGTCRYATFELTPTGRIKRDSVGRCAYRVQLPALPLSARVEVRYVCVEAPEKNCPCWQKKVTE
jgi:hypothetical protein